MSEQPNVLILMSDEHRSDVTRFGGNDVVRTPTLDWLADTGTVFTNAYTPAPVCIPARHSIRTGKLPRTWARDDFEAFESPEYPTLPRQVARSGYMTASGGKEHYPGWNQMVGWRKRIGPTPVKQHGIGAEMIADAPNEAFDGQRGFAEWKWSAGTEIARAGVADARTQVQDRRVIEGVEQYVREFFSSPYYDRGQPDTPLLLKTSLIQPHYPYFTDSEELFTYYLNRVDPYIEDPEEFHPVMSHTGRRVTPGKSASEREIRRATAAYYAMTERIDELFGRVLDALEANGEDLDEWVIVFTSDHGEFLGQRGMWGKNSFYEESVNVPLVIRYPARFEGGVIEENVSLCDLYATICEVTEVSLPPSLDSRSLLPLLSGDTDGWMNEAISQRVSNGALQSGVDRDHLMIKRDELKYCYYGEDEAEVLFDLECDPSETTNYAGKPQYADDLLQFRERRHELGYGPDADPDYTNSGY